MTSGTAGRGRRGPGRLFTSKFTFTSNLSLEYFYSVHAHVADRDMAAISRIIA